MSAESFCQRYRIVKLSRDDLPEQASSVDTVLSGSVLPHSSDRQTYDYVEDPPRQIA
jgi:hypothetical protein